MPRQMRCRASLGLAARILHHPQMSPTLFRDGELRFFFFSREEPRVHVHVAASKGEAKFWLEPPIRLAHNFGPSSRQLHIAEGLVRRHENEIRRRCSEHFAG
ncbi:MAG TPA: DUF4160 domain-containing protein [Casimicrobiaceae bacterium]|nr:DUF4160 domain-containing protein [Casimicrobiaceae bacterium]